MALNYIKVFVSFISPVSDYVSISASASLAEVCIASSVVGIKICAIAVRIKNYKSVITKNRKKLNAIKVLISKA